MATRRDTRGFQAAVQALLAPLARYARAQGIDADEFARIVARAARGRIASIEPALPYDAAVRIVSRWSTERPYAQRGKARPLEAGGAGSFASLVRAARAGSPGTARRALIAAGLVKQDRAGRLHLRQTSYVPTSGDAMVDILGRAGADFVRVLAHNIEARPDERFLQRVASYDNIGASSLMTLRGALRREGLRALQRANALLAAKDRDRNPRARGGRRTRVGFGVYVFETPEGARRRRSR